MTKEVAEVTKRADEAEKKADEAEKKALNMIREMLFDSIAELGAVSEAIHKRIEKEEDISILKVMHKAAIKSQSIEQFEKQIANL